MRQCSVNTETRSKVNRALRKMGKSGGQSCIVLRCKHSWSKSRNKTPPVTFHRVPKDLESRKKWLDSCSRTDLVARTSIFVCSDHFNSDDFMPSKTSKVLRNLKKGVLPCRNLTHEPCLPCLIQYLIYLTKNIN